MRTFIFPLLFSMALAIFLPVQLLAQTGSLDSTFDGDGIGQYAAGNLHDICNDMVILPDDKLLIAGVTQLNGMSGPYSGMLMRILSNGSIDSTWGTNGIVSWIYNQSTYVQKVILQPDGKILVSGFANVGPDNYDMFVARFTASGTPDPSFNSTGHIILPYATEQEYCYAMALQPDGKIVIAGGIFMGSSALLFARVNSDGTLDTGFGISGYCAINSSYGSEFINTLGILSNGTIVGMGSADQGDPLWVEQAIMVKLTPSGAPMPGFGTNGVLVPPIFNTSQSVTNKLEIVNDTIYATGNYVPLSQPRSLFLTKLDTNGTASPTFGNGGIHLTSLNPSNTGCDIKIFGDNKIYITGLTGPPGFGDNNIITLRYTANGLPDLSWNNTGYMITNVRPDGDCGYAIEIQSDGKVVVAGVTNGMSTSGDNDVFVVRYLNDYSGFYANFSVSDSSLCNSGTVTFNNLSSPNTTSYLWTFQGGTPSTSTAVNPTVSYSILGDFDVTLQAFEGTQSTTKSVDNLIQVSSIPSTPGLPVGSNSLCTGTVTTYTINPIDYAISYFWEVTPSQAGTISGNSTTGTFTSSYSYTGPYTVKVQATGLCGTSPWSLELLCQLNRMPEAFSLQGGGNYCQGNTGVAISLSGSETGVNYELFLNESPTGLIQAGTGNPLSWSTVAAEGNYTIKGYTVFCENQMTGQVVVVSLTIPVQPDIPDGPVTACAGMSSNYYTYNIPYAVSYNWYLIPSNAGVLLPNGTGATINWSPEYTGVASVSVSAENECGTGPASTPLSIAINTLPVTIISGYSTACLNWSSNYSTNQHEGSIYTWDITGGSITSGAGTNSITVIWNTSGTQTITVTETTAEGCSGVAVPYEVAVDACTNLDLTGNEPFAVYPNPASSTISVSSGFTYSGDCSIQIVDITGRIVLKTIVPSSTGEIHDINISKLVKGIYVVQLINNEKVAKQAKLVKE